jgi:hypothetical protein
MRWMVGLSLRFGVLVVAIAAGGVFLGVSQLRGMPVDVLPEFTPPYVEIQTEALGLSAEEVEQLITVPLEQDLLNGVPWLAEIRSESLPGLSSVVMTFDPGTDPLRARQVVGERLTQAFALPHVSKPPTMLQPMSATSRVMMVGLSSTDLSLIDLSVLARWTIAPRLMGVAGVANVSIWGQRDRQLQVQVDPARLRANNLTLLQVLETTGNAMWVSSLSFVEASTPGTGGFIDTANQRLGIRHVFPISSPEGLAQVPVEGTAHLRLGDVARAETNPPTPAGASGETTAPTCAPVTGFAAGDSSATTTIDNKWLPLVPGKQFTLVGHANAAGESVAHTVVLTVTDLTKVVSGVPTVVLWDRDVDDDGEVAEAELAFHAQDSGGNVWNFGEYPEVYEDGKFAGAPDTWITGQAQAEAGVSMLAEPRLGTPSYLQGRVPTIDFLDCAQVFATGQSLCVPAGCYQDVLVTDETSPHAGNGHQRKYYAAGVGNIQISAVDDPEGETLELSKVADLSPQALADARAEALKLEQRAYQVSEVYRSTPPAEPMR